MAESTSAFADAVVALATGLGALDTVEEQLLRVARTIESDAELRGIVTDMHAPLGKRLALVETKVLEAAHPATRAALAMMIAGEGASELVSVARAVAERSAAAKNKEYAEVYVAQPLQNGQAEKLTAALEKATGKSLAVNFVTDPSLVGGVRAEIGDTVIDGSVSGRLDSVRSAIAQ